MKLLLGIPTLVAAFFGLMVLSELAWTTAPEPVTRDPLRVIEAFNDALNSRNVDVALALFADPFTFTDPAGEMSTGRDSLRGWFRSHALENDRTEISDVWLRGESVTWVTRVHRGGILLHSTSTALVQDGKIVSFAAHQPEQHSTPCAIIISETTGLRMGQCAGSETPNEEEFYPTD